MKSIIVLFLAVILSTCVGCETVHDTTKEAGTYIGKGADAFGGVTEGAAEGMQGEVTSKENPYER